MLTDLPRLLNGMAQCTTWHMAKHIHVNSVRIFLL